MVTRRQFIKDCAYGGAGLIATWRGVVPMVFADTDNCKQKIEVAILFDVTKSMTQAIEENKKRTETILAALPQSACVTAVGITTQSFSNPIKLLDRQCIPSRDFLLDVKHLEAGRNIINQWRSRSASLTASSPKTDVFGALFQAMLLFSQNPMSNEKFLFLLSDMRHDSYCVNLTEAPEIPASFLDKVRKEDLIVQLPSVRVWVLLHTYGMNQKYFISLFRFWQKYFEEANAHLMGFSPFFQIENLFDVQNSKLRGDLKSAGLSHGQSNPGR